MSTKKPHDEDAELFRRMVADVTPLAADEHVAPIRPRPAPRRRAATGEADETAGFVEREHAAPVGPDEALFFARPGLQHRLQRKLRRGEITPQARLDLHGRSIAEAGSQLAAFLASAPGAGRRCVLVVHGKGHRSPEGRPALKAQVKQWLHDTPAVLAFSTAQPRDGGAGALYVLLRRT